MSATVKSSQDYGFCEHKCHLNTLNVVFWYANLRF